LIAMNLVRFGGNSANGDGGVPYDEDAGSCLENAEERSGMASRRYVAARDMTSGKRVRELVRWGESSLVQGCRELVIDLGRVETMNSSLVAGLVLLSRRGRPLGATIRLIDAPARLHALLQIYRVHDALRARGLVFEPERPGFAGGEG